MTLVTGTAMTLMQFDSLPSSMYVEMYVVLG